MPTVALTTQYVKALKPPATGRIEVWDERTPGLCLRLSSTGKGAWSYRYRPREGAGYQRMTLGTLEDLGLADARERAARQRAAVVDGRDPQRERIARREAARKVLTFDVVAQRYLDEYAKPRKTSWRSDEGHLKRPRAKWGDWPAADVGRRDVIELLDEIKATAPVSANRLQSILVTMFNWSVEGELLDANPIARMRKRAKETAKDRTLSDDEIRVLWPALDGGDGLNLDTAAALRLMLLVGQRPGEVAGLLRSELRDLDRAEAARIEIAGARMKAGRAHVVPLPEMARTLLIDALKRRDRDAEKDMVREARSGATSVFASKFVARDALARHSLSQGLRRVVAALDVEKGKLPEAVRSLQTHPPTPHDFRRTVATGMARLGVAREDRKAVLGHVEDDVHGRHYDRHERLAEKRAALVLWGGHVSSIVVNDDAR